MSYNSSHGLASCPLSLEDLQSALAKLSNRLDTVYPPAERANLSHRESILKIEILSFRSDELSIPLVIEI
jgi:hypothetical protein